MRTWGSGCRIPEACWLASVAELESCSKRPFILIRWSAEEEDNTIHLCLCMHTCMHMRILPLLQLSGSAFHHCNIWDTNKRKSLLAHMLLEALVHYQLAFLLLGLWWDSALWHYVAKQSNSPHGWWERGSQNPKISFKDMPEIIPYFSSPIS